MENDAVLKSGAPQLGTQPGPDTFDIWRRDILKRTELALEHWLPARDVIPARLHEAMRYAALGGGKRFRPMLCHASGASVAADRDALDAVSAVICPLLSGPKLMIFWITKETRNAEQETSPGRDYRQAA